MKKGKFILLILGAFLVIGVYFLSSRDSTREAPTITSISDSWLEYQNQTRKFSFSYPPELEVKEYDEGDGTYTLVFADASNEKSFQIFFTPYLGEVITKSRILKDIPSGEFTDPLEVMIGDNTRALLFFSKGSLGQMREVWFLNKGFLYEITTEASLDTWLAQILDTWSF